VLLADVCSSKFVEPAKSAVYEFQSDTVLRAAQQRSPPTSKQQQQHQPSRIEDYEPGCCSLAVGNHIEVTKFVIFSSVPYMGRL